MATSTPIQWTIDRLFSVLHDVQARAGDQGRQISSLRGRLTELQRFWAKFTGPPAPGSQDALARALKRQDVIESTYRRGVKFFADLAAKVNGFLRSHGIEPSAGLSGLGAVPLVIPVAIVAGALVALALVKWGDDALRAHSPSVAMLERAYGDRAAGRISDAVYQQTLAAINGQADQAMPRGDPLGLTNVVHALIPVGILVAVIVLGPPLLEAVLPRRRRRLAA